jgi:hypothetical protein
MVIDSQLREAVNLSETTKVIIFNPIFWISVMKYPKFQSGPAKNASGSLTGWDTLNFTKLNVIFTNADTRK